LGLLFGDWTEELLRNEVFFLDEDGDKENANSLSPNWSLALDSLDLVRLDLLSPPLVVLRDLAIVGYFSY